MPLWRKKPKHMKAKNPLAKFKNPPPKETPKQRLDRTVRNATIRNDELNKRKE